MRRKARGFGLNCVPISQGLDPNELAARFIAAGIEPPPPPVDPAAADPTRALGVDVQGSSSRPSEPSTPVAASTLVGPPPPSSVSSPAAGSFSAFFTPRSHTTPGNTPDRTPMPLSAVSAPNTSSSALHGQRGREGMTTVNSAASAQSAMTASDGWTVDELVRAPIIVFFCARVCI